MKRPIRSLIMITLFCVILVIVAILLKPGPNEENSEKDVGVILQQKDPDSIKDIYVSNEFGDYEVNCENNEIYVTDIPTELMNSDYVLMLLDECSNVKCSSLVEKNTEDLSKYGLEEPNAKVSVRYVDGSELKLNIGDMEPISDSRYVCLSDNNDVYLMKNNRTIRFCMPVEKYINYIIIPPNETQNVLHALQDVTFSGEQLSQPIELKAVLSDRAKILNVAKSFGAVTHLITSPYLHEADQTALTEITDSLFGLISEGIIDYNCTKEELAEYGFDSPLLRIEFDYKNGDVPAKHYDLRLAQSSDGWIATLNDQGVIYKIADVGFLSVNYEQLVSRWFLSPLIIEVAGIDISFDNNNYEFELSGDTSKDLNVSFNDINLDIDLFRKYYSLLVSASIEDKLPIDYELGEVEPILSITYHYLDGDKPDDTLCFYTIEAARRVLVQTNGTREFSAQERFVEYVINATNNLVCSKDFETNWQ